MGVDHIMNLDNTVGFPHTVKLDKNISWNETRDLDNGVDCTVDLNNSVNLSRTMDNAMTILSLISWNFLIYWSSMVIMVIGTPVI